MDVLSADIRPWLQRTTWLIGVVLTACPSARAGDVPTYHRDVVPILQKNCQECHRPGQVAPFSLLEYAQARKRADDIATVTEQRTMPPWHASTTEGGPFRDARVLTDRERKTLADWAEAGAPEGNAKDTPPPREWSSDWLLGPPDLVLKVNEPYALHASGPDEYRVFVLPSGLTKGRWIAAADFKPGNMRVVHHILAAYDTTGTARKLDAADKGPGYATSGGGYGRLPSGLPFLPSGQLWGWAPGRRPNRSPEGTARALPAGADVLIQVHYHKSGKPETDATTVGLYFAEGPVDKQIRSALVMPRRPIPFGRPELRIPAGAANHEVKGETTIRDDSHLLAVFPHMHLLGKDYLLTAVRPDGSRQTLIRIDDWDFNWQNPYEFVTPVALPRGTKVEVVAHFDNSPGNIRNPSKPPIEVHWGEQTTDEMCIGFMQVTRDSEHLGNRSPDQVRPAFRGRGGAVADESSNPPGRSPR
jgi:Copper type II ascorbate-dependent monooxygenase, C-terminal domain